MGMKFNLQSVSRQAEDCVAAAHLVQAVRLVDDNEKLVKLQINQQQESDSKRMLMYVNLNLIWGPC